MSSNRKKEYRNKIALMLLLSIVVFLIIGFAMLLTFLILYLLSLGGIMKIESSQVGLLGIMEFIFCSSLIIGLILTNSMGSAIILKPVYRMITQLNRLAEGDFSARLHFGRPIGDYPTFRQVEKSFNRAAEELENTRMLHSDFINNFSHEFRTPIVSIAGFAKLLRKGTLTEDKKREYLEVIEEESLRLADMASSVMTLSKVENMRILTDLRPVNLSEEIRSCVLLLEKKWTQKNIDMDIQAGEYSVIANDELMRHVWINLLDNAIKFSPENGRIEVRVTEEGNAIAVSVSNSSPDIPEDKISHIFNKFYQVDQSHSAKGNGIGLAVVKRITELHNGSVNCLSSGGTTTFTVLLPKSNAD